MPKDFALTQQSLLTLGRSASVLEGRGRGGSAPADASAHAADAGLTQKKHLSRGRSGGAAEPPRGRLPAGRQASKPPTARRRSEETLAAAGKETALDTAARLESQGKTTAARALREWVNLDPERVFALLRSLPATRGGSPRELRVGMCGVAFVARRGGVVGFARRACKDRLCPHCSARRSRRFAASLRQFVSTLPAANLRFATFTQAKVRLEDPRAALDRLLKSFRALLRNAWGRRNILGGVRAVEVTARQAGAAVGDYVVRIPGIHAHIHAILELAPGVTARDLAAAWVASSAGASAGGVDVQVVDEGNIYQCAKYPLDMSGLVDLVEGAPDYVRRVLVALHGRRLVEAFGAWRHAPLGLREEEGTLVYGDRSVYGLATSADGLLRWADGRVEPADDVLAAFLAGPVEPL